MSEGNANEPRPAGAGEERPADRSALEPNVAAALAFDDTPGTVQQVPVALQPPLVVLTIPATGAVERVPISGPAITEPSVAVTPSGDDMPTPPMPIPLPGTGKRSGVVGPRSAVPAFVLSVVALALAPVLAYLVFGAMRALLVPDDLLAAAGRRASLDRTLSLVSGTGAVLLALAVVFWIAAAARRKHWFPAHAPGFRIGRWMLPVLVAAWVFVLVWAGELRSAVASRALQGVAWSDAELAADLAEHEVPEAAAVAAGIGIAAPTWIAELGKDFGAMRLLAGGDQVLAQSAEGAVRVVGADGSVAFASQPGDGGNRGPAAWAGGKFWVALPAGPAAITPAGPEILTPGLARYVGIHTVGDQVAFVRTDATVIYGSASHQRRLFAASGVEASDGRHDVVLLVSRPSADLVQLGVHDVDDGSAVLRFVVHAPGRVAAALDRARAQVLLAVEGPPEPRLFIVGLDGVVRFKLALERMPSDITVAGAVALLRAPDALTGVGLDAGNRMWQLLLDDSTPPLALGKQVAVGLEGVVHLVDLRTSQTAASLPLPPRGRPVALAASDAALFVGFADGAVARFPWLRPPPEPVAEPVPAQPVPSPRRARAADPAARPGPPALRGSPARLPGGAVQPSRPGVTPP